MTYDACYITLSFHMILTSFVQILLPPEVLLGHLCCPFDTRWKWQVELCDEGPVRVEDGGLRASSQIGWVCHGSIFHTLLCLQDHSFTS